MKTEYAHERGHNSDKSARETEATALHHISHISPQWPRMTQSMGSQRSQCLPRRATEKDEAGEEKGRIRPSL